MCFVLCYILTYSGFHNFKPSFPEIGVDGQSSLQYAGGDVLVNAVEYVRPLYYQLFSNAELFLFPFRMWVGTYVLATDLSNFKR